MRSSAVMAAGTAVSRVLGFVKAAILLAAVSPGNSADTFSVANTVPNALYILLAGGILNAVLVPQITRAARQPDGGQEYIDRLLTMSIALLFLVTAAVTLAAPFSSSSTPPTSGPTPRSRSARRSPCGVCHRCSGTACTRS